MTGNTILFNPSKERHSLGVELELQVLDRESLLLAPRAHEIIEKLSVDNIRKEFFQSTLEVVTGICTTVHNAEKELCELLQSVIATAESLGLKIGSTGTHPEADYRERMITPSARYNELADRNQWLIRRMAVYGMHVHIGMPSADQAIQFNNFLLHFVPHLLALSASSPFWQRIDTGLSSARPTLYESMPTCGMPYVVKNWKQFQQLYNVLVRTHSITSMKDLWWDVRPSPMLGTVELRVCDQPATLRESLAIVAFVHALSHWFADHTHEWRAKHRTVQRWVLRENKWRAIRTGLSGEIISGRNKKLIGISDDILFWLDNLQPYLDKLDYAKYATTIVEILRKGNSSQRQRAIFEQTKNLHEVTRFNVHEFESSLWR